MRVRMTFGSGTRTALGAAVALGLAFGLAEARDLRIATWNLEHLNDEHGEGCVERTGEDYDAIARRIETLDADVVAFQEVENEAAARRVFDPAKWNVVVSSRLDTGEGPTCYNRPEGRLQHQATGIAVRRSMALRRRDDVSALAGGNPYLRWGAHVVVGRGDAELHILSVHLKSGCWGTSQDEQGREACTVLGRQVDKLRSWVDERQRNGESFAIAGDFNRRLAIPGDWAWNALSPRTRPLELATVGRRSRCDSRFPHYIDHIVVWGPEGTVAKAGSFREEARDGPHPDHCALSLALGDGPAGSTETRTALRAWLGAFARTSTDQLVGGIERRLARAPGAYTTPDAAALFAMDGAPDLAELVSRGSFLLSPGDDSGDTGWSLWGAGAMGSMSTDEHDVRGRVRTATVGADIDRGAATLGLALSHSRGLGSTVPTGPIDGELTSVAPYFGLEPRQGVSLWGVLGKGTGRLTLEPTAGAPIRTDLETTLGAAGLRAELSEAYEIRWSSRVSAALTAIETGQMADLDSIDSSAGRLRAGLEGSRRFALRDTASLTPSLEVGLRHDAGDDATGTALELGAGLHYAGADRRLVAEGRAKGYLAGDDGEGWELGGQLELRPDARRRGLSLTVAPTWGTSRGERSASPTEAWHSGDAAAGAGRLAAEIGYGIAFAGGRGNFRPYAGFDWAGDDDHEVRVGARWRSAEGWRCAVTAERETAGDETGALAFIATTEVRWK